MGHYRECVVENRVVSSDYFKWDWLHFQLIEEYQLRVNLFYNKIKMSFLKKKKIQIHLNIYVNNYNNQFNTVLHCKTQFRK